MSIHINCPNCHITSSLTLPKFSAQIPILPRPSSGEHPSPTADLSDIPIEGAMRRPLPLELRHRENAQPHMARHGHRHRFPGPVVTPNHGNPVLPPPHGQPQQFFWEGFGIPTRGNGDAQYAIQRAVQYAYEKGYEDARKGRERYHSFKKVLDETDRKESDELKDRLSHERQDLTRSYIGGLTASQIRGYLEEAQRGIRRHQTGHKENQNRRQRDRSRSCSRHHTRSPTHNQRNRGKRPEHSCKWGCGNSGDTGSSESYDENDGFYR